MDFLRQVNATMPLGQSRQAGKRSGIWVAMRIHEVPAPLRIE